MTTIISILTIGFSVLSSLILLLVYVFFLKNVNRHWYAIASCAALLISLSALQLWHLDFFYSGLDVLEFRAYRFWLFLTPPMFYFFSRATLLPDAGFRPILLIHLLPLGLNFFPRYEITLPFIFVLGMGYCFWLSKLVFALREQRKRFIFEFFFFTLFSAIGLIVLILGLSISYIDHIYFYVFYTLSIGVSYVLIVGSMIAFPNLLSELAEVAKLRYAATTLKDVDIEAKLNFLKELMSTAKLYQNENLDLAITAEAMSLTPHQLSELVNRQFGVNFSRYIREQRVDAAKTILISEPKSSVLSVGLESGFGTQSNFYAAFKEITGMSPGAYRKSLAKE